MIPVKKIIAVLLALLLLLCGCSDEKNPLAESTGEEAIIIPDENVPAEMRVVYADERALKLEIKNISENEIIFSNDFNIQIFEDGKWCDLEIIENAAFTEPAYPVEPGETREDEIGFAYLYGSLSEGEYRVIKSIGEDADGITGGKHNFFKAAAEFSIPFVYEEEIIPEEQAEPEDTEEPAEAEKLPGEKLPGEKPEEPAPIPEEEPAEEKEEDSDMKKNNGGFSFISGPSDSGKDAAAIENTFVLRANGMGKDAEETMWRLYAANEKISKTDKPIMVFDSADKLKSFYTDMEGTYQFGSGEGSAKEKILSYDEKYFEENALIIIHIQSNSGSVRYTVTDVNVSGGTCNIAVNAKMPEVGTMDMADWFILIEQPKTAIGNCDAFKLKIN